MKKAIKIASASVIAVAAAGIAAASAFAWGDSAGGRRTYTIAEINGGALDGKIVFNSIADTDENALTEEQRAAGNILPLTDERFFVGARVNDGTANGTGNVWASNTIEVEEGKEYIVRMYVHNNNKEGLNAIARDVTTTFKLGGVVDSEQRVEGYIDSSNATPNQYYDSVVFKSSDGRKFYLDYVEGSALIESNGAVGGSTLSDSIISTGVKIGYNALDGNLPGCYKYAAYVGIVVKPVFEDSSIDKQVRLLGTKEWKNSIAANIGDKVEYQIHYKNLNNSTVNNIVVRDSLPDGLQYVEGTTRLYSSIFPEGAVGDKDTLTTTGINAGDYLVNGDAYIRFTAEVVDESLACGNNRLINWAKVSANGFAVQDSADVYVTKVCEETPETPEQPEQPTAPATQEAKALPTTGVTGVVASALGLGSVVTAAGYAIASRKNH